MKEARYLYIPSAAVETELSAEEAVHAIRILQLKEGDEMFLMGSEGCFYRVEVALILSKKYLYTIKETLKQRPVWCGKIHFATASTEDIGRIEQMTERATEAGFNGISFLDCKFPEYKALRADRIEKIAASAAEQSRKGWKPIVNPMTPFHRFIENCSSSGRKLICCCCLEISRADFFIAISQEGQPSSAENITMLVGPEGGSSIDEIRFTLGHGSESAILDDSRLRIETAGLGTVMMSQFARRA